MKKSYLEQCLQKEMRVRAFSLLEIMVGLFIMAFTFIPLINLLMGTLEFTKRDDRTITAINLCYSKLKRAVEFPFLEIAVGTYGGTGQKTFSTKDGTPDLFFGAENIKGTLYRTTLNVTQATGTFTLDTFNFTGLEDVSSSFSDSGTDMTKYFAVPANWSSKTVTYDNFCKRYSVTVEWQPSEKQNAINHYTLSMLKGNFMGFTQVNNSSVQE